MIAFDTQTEIPVMEHFYSIQGEGFFQGTPAYFIRLAGCDVGCSWCDVKDSWHVSADQVIGIEALAAALDTIPAGICVITGGEPAMYDLGPLTRALRQSGWKVHIETSGAYPVSGEFDWICVSPKKFKPALADWLEIADEIKVIVYNRHDLDWAAQFARYGRAGKVRFFLQPEWEKEKIVLPLIIDHVKMHPWWAISLQIHKYLGID